MLNFVSPRPTLQQLDNCSQTRTVSESQSYNPGCRGGRFGGAGYAPQYHHLSYHCIYIYFITFIVLDAISAVCVRVHIHVYLFLRQLFRLFL